MLFIKNTFLFLLLTLLINACGGVAEFENLTPATISSLTLQDIFRVVSTGNSLSFNARTGGMNDLALDPTTGRPALAYYDRSSTAGGNALALGALKYAYQDSSGAWKIDVVDVNHGTAACGTANSYCVGAPNAAAGSAASIIKLAFKSSGLPAIAYVFGASVNTAGGSKQIRFAEKLSSGKWVINAAFSSFTSAGASNASVTTTVDPMKGVTLFFDSQDRPHITFTLYAQTLTNSSIYYLFRASNGSWSNTAITSAMTAGTITNLGQGNNQSGHVVCPSNNLPIWVSSVVDGAAGASKPLYIRCTSLASDGSCSAFSVLNLANGCGAGQTCFASGITTASDAGRRMDIAIDSATQRPILGIFSTVTPNVTLLTLTAPSACGEVQDTSAGGWGNPVTVAAGSAGVNGFRLASSSSTLNTNFLAYLNSTTSVMVNKATGPDGAWLGTGTTIETTTVAGEGVGFAYNATSDIAYLSYASTPASAIGAIGNDIKLAYGNEALITNAGSAGSFYIENIDNDNTVFPTTPIPSLSAAKSARGIYGYAYFYQDVTAADSRLYYGFRSGPASAPTFATNIVVNHIEGGASPLFVGSYPSLAYDSNDNPVIAFYNGVAAQQNLNLARSSNGGVSFSITVVDDVAANVGQYPSVSTYKTAIGIAYYDVTNRGLKFARYTPSLGWRLFSVDGMAGTGSCGNVADDAGAFAVLRFTSQGRPLIAYQSQTKLKIAYASESVSSTSYTWSCLVLDDSATVRGSGISFELASGDVLRLAHFDSTMGSLRYVTCANGITSCLTIGSSAFSGTSLASLGTTTTITTKPSLAIDPNGKIYISYHSATEQALMLASLAVGSTTWVVESIDQNTSGSTHMSQVGQYPQMLMNDFNLPMIFYRSNENWLKYFSREWL